jgi:hypothetical protein
VSREELPTCALEAGEAAESWSRRRGGMIWLVAWGTAAVAAGDPKLPSAFWKMEVRVLGFVVLKVEPPDIAEKPTGSTAM